MEKTDIELIDAYERGEKQAFETLMARYIKTVYNFAYRLMGNTTDAEDVTQESFFKAWRYIKKYKPEFSFKTWILSIARNTAIDLMRKRKSLNFSDLDFKTAEGDIKFEETIADTEPLPEEIASREEIGKELEAVLDKLPVNAKAIVLMHLTEGMTFEEIARVIGEPMNTVKSRYRRVLESLRDLHGNQFAPK